MNDLFNTIEGAVTKTTFLVCTGGRCSFEIEDDYYELAKNGSIILLKGQRVSSLTCSEDFSAASFEAPAQILPLVEARNENSYPDRSSELFVKFKALLDSHYNREHEPLFYAKRLHITSKYLASICKNSSGLSVKELIDQKLLRDASFLLEHTNKTISQISETLHFGSPELFGKFFKRMSSLSPRQFRQCETAKQI